MGPRDRGDALDDQHRNEYARLRGALHDRITGLPAYPLLFDTLRNLLDRRRHLGVLHVDIANLEMVESLYGWQVFDRILARVADSLRRAAGDDLPPTALLAVNGVAGDRFVAFVPEVQGGTEVRTDDLVRIASALQARLEREFDGEDFAGLSPRLVFRVGHSLLSENPFYRFERRVHAAVEEARALSQRRGRRWQMTRGAELRKIIRDAAVSTVFQPVVDLLTRDVIGYEAFARGPKDTHFEMPSAMFALSSRLGVSAELDRLCRTTALGDSGKVVGRGSARLFLNVLASSIADPVWFRESLSDLLVAAELRPADLVLEVSERGADSDVARLAGAFAALRGLGFGVALDDVGTGYASLATLEQVRPDFLKVDVSLVHGVHQNLIKQELLSSLVNIGKRIGAEVIAEGVESENEASAVSDAGAKYGQGFLFAGPAAPGAPGWLLSTAPRAPEAG